MWATKKTDASEISAILNDTHSPAKIRVNAVLSAMDKFYEVCDIQPGNGMYKAQKKDLQYCKIKYNKKKAGLNIQLFYE